jgi:DNA-binding NtrC family response regulator
MTDSGTVRAAKHALAVVREPAFRLHVQKGPDAGKVFVLEGTQAPRVLLGTSPTCDFRLTDKQVSRRHLSLELARGSVRITELESTNGTTSRGVRFKEIFAQGGETLELGETVIFIAVDAESGVPLVSDESAFGRTIGQSVAMRRLYPLCAKLAATTIPAIIEGETGTGKELMTECIHEVGPRSNGPYVALESAALRPDDAEEVLAAAFAEAHGGTLVLEEIADLDAAVQSILHRVLARREAKPENDVRLLTTTKRDLDREVTEGRFRDDLYFRIAVARLELPPLRRRPEDVNVLADLFWTRLNGPASGIPQAARERFAAYHWPGNVRELHNAVHRLVALGDADGRTDTDDATSGASSEPKGDFLATVIAEHLPLAAARQRVVDEFERRYVQDAFMRNGQNVTRAAAASGIARRYFRALRARQRQGD